MSNNLFAVKEIRQYIKKKPYLKKIGNLPLVYFAFAAGGTISDFFKNDFNSIRESLMAYFFFWLLGFLFMFFSFLVAKNNYFHLDKNQKIAEGMEGYDFHMICKYYENRKSEVYGNLYMSKNTYKFVSYEKNKNFTLEGEYGKGEVMIGSDKIINKRDKMIHEYLTLATESGPLNFVIACPDRVQEAMNALT